MWSSGAVNSPSPQHRSTTTMPGRTPISTRTFAGSGHNACHQLASGIVVAGKKPAITGFCVAFLSRLPMRDEFVLGHVPRQHFRAEQFDLGDQLTALDASRGQILLDDKHRDLVL